MATMGPGLNCYASLDERPSADAFDATRAPRRKESAVLSDLVRRPRWPSTGRGRVIVVAGIGFSLVMAAVLAFMATVPLNGDEQFYVDRARALAEFVRGEDRSLWGVTRHVVHNGWFMPGMAMVLTPLFVVAPDAPVAVTRLYVLLVHAGLWWWAAWELRRAFGRTGLTAFLVFPTAAVMWLVFTLTAWADPAAGLVVAVVGARAHGIGCRLLERRSVPLRELVVMELAMVALVYLRGNAIGLVAAVHAVLVVVALMPGRRGVRVRGVAALATGLVLFAGLLAPWSLAASQKLDGPVVTTSSSALAVGVTFGDEDALCFGPCPPNGVWAGELQFSRQYAREHGISPLEAQRLMAASALEGVTVEEYVAQVRDNTRAFVVPTGDGPRRGQPFIERFAELTALPLDSSGVAVVRDLVRVLTLAVYVPFLVALVIANLGVFVRSGRSQVMSLLVKAMTAAFFVQPFVHQSHARYWTGYATVMTLAAVLLAGTLRSVAGGGRSTIRWGAVRRRVRELDGADRYLAAFQVLYATSVAVVAGVVLLA